MIPSRLAAGAATSQSALEAIVLKCLKKNPDGAMRPPSSWSTISTGSWLASQSWPARRTHGKSCVRKARRHPAAWVIRRPSLALRGNASGRRLVVRGPFARKPRVDPAATRRSSRPRAGQRGAQYVADIRQVPRYIRNYQTSNADELLMRHRPRSGEDDLRGFAWYYLRLRGHTERRTLTGHHGDLYHVEFSPRGDSLAGTGKDGMVLIWDTSSWKPLREIMAARTEVNVTAFSLDGTTIATVDDDGKLKLWEIATGVCQLERLAHAGGAVIARFTPDGKSIVTGGRKDGLLKLWDLKSGSMLESFQADASGLENAVFSPGGSSLATVGAQGVKLWHWPSGRRSSRSRQATMSREWPSRTTGPGWRRRMGTTRRFGSGRSPTAASRGNSVVTPMVSSRWPSRPTIERSSRQAMTRRFGSGTWRRAGCAASTWDTLAASGTWLSPPTARPSPPPARTGPSSSGTSTRPTTPSGCRSRNPERSDSRRTGKP